MMPLDCKLTILVIIKGVGQFIITRVPRRRVKTRILRLSRFQLVRRQVATAPIDTMTKNKDKILSVAVWSSILQQNGRDPAQRLHLVMADDYLTAHLMQGIQWDIIKYLLAMYLCKSSFHLPDENPCPYQLTVDIVSNFNMKILGGSTRVTNVITCGYLASKKKDILQAKSLQFLHSGPLSGQCHISNETRTMQQREAFPVQSDPPIPSADGSLCDRTRPLEFCLLGLIGAPALPSVTRILPSSPHLHHPKRLLFNETLSLSHFEDSNWRNLPTIRRRQAPPSPYLFSVCL